MGFLPKMWKIPFFLVLGFTFVHYSDAALSAMSIDLGSQFIKLGIVKPGVPMEIVLNKESRRKSPNILSIKNNERLFSEAAMALSTKYPNSAYQYTLNLLSKQEGDESVELYKQRFPFAAITFDEQRKTVVFPSESESYNVETLLSMILWYCKKTTEAYAGMVVKDVIITVPIYFNQAERRALTVAADIAGLNLLQIMNDGSAAALNYGVFRRKEITEKPQTMLIYDMGASKTVATIVEYALEAEKNSKDMNPVVRTIGVGYDKTLGGLEISLRMRKHLEEIFDKTVKTTKPIGTTARSMAKLLKEAERVKQVLSANKDTFAQVEGLHEEHNFRAKVTREELEEMISDLIPRFNQPIIDALKMAEMTIEQVDQFVLMGGSTRIPRLQEEMKQLLGEKEIGRFLNTDEAIALGAVYQAAHLSKAFKVLPFKIQELIIYPVNVHFKTITEEGEEKDATRTIFGYKTYYPTPNKIINFQSYKEDFEVVVNYGNNSHMPVTDLVNVKISGVADAIAKEDIDNKYNILKGVKASFTMGLSGIFDVVKADVHVEKKPTDEELQTYADKLKAYEEYEKEEKELKEKQKEAEKAKKEEEKKKDDTEEKKEATEEKKEEELTTEDKEATTTTTEAPKREKLTKPKEPQAVTQKVKLTVETSQKDLQDLTVEQVEQAKKVLQKFEDDERERSEREEAMNVLEAQVYDLPIKLEDGEEFVQFVTDEEKEKILNEVKTLRLWLEDDVTFETKTSEFKEKKKILDDLVAAAEIRKKESLGMPEAIEAMNNMFNHSSVFLKTARNLTTTEDPVFTETELEVLDKLINTTTEWWTEKFEAYLKQKKNEDPLITVADVAEKYRELDREVKYLLNKLKSFVPKKKPEPKKTEKAEDSDKKTPEEETTTTTEESATSEESTTKKDKEHDASEL